MDYSIDRRLFMKSATATSLFALISGDFQSLWADVLQAKRQLKKPAVIRGAFFYPPLEVVLKGEFEDGWRKEKWCTWPGNQFKPEEQQKKFMKHAVNVAKNLDIDLRIDKKSIYTKVGIRKFIQDIQANRPDALLLYNFWNTMSRELVPVLEAYDGPIIVYHPVGANHQLPPKHFETAPRVQYIHSIENWNAIERGLRAVHTQNFMSQSRLLRISGRLKGEKTVTNDFFGMTIHEVPTAHFNALFDEIEYKPEMEKMARKVRAEAIKVDDLADKAFEDAVRAHAAVNKIMQQYKADAITIECLFLKHRKPCLSFAVNNGNLVPCGCENVLDASLSLMLGSNLFGRGGFQHNPEFDTEENLYFASHCTCAMKLHGPQGKSTPYLLRPFFHQMPKTLALDVQWPEGEQVTLFKYNSAKKELDAWSGVVQGSPACPPTGGCATRVLVKIKDVKDIRDVYPGPHPILYCGDFVKQVKTYAELYSLKVHCNA